jgi:deazaflavin-dependent oxidoreductase (nitroreductase family)
MWYNAIMIGLLRSPLHHMLSGSMLLVTYTGRKSGKTFTLPVSYFQTGDALLTISFRHRTWWRNLRAGADVKLRLRGKDVAAHAEVIEDDSGVASALGEIVHVMPQAVRFLRLKVDEKGQPLAGELEQAARERVVIRTQPLVT